MASVVRLLGITVFALGFVGCGGGTADPQDERFNATVAPDVTLATDVRNTVNQIEPGSDLAGIGAELAESLGEEMENPATESHRDTYQKIIDAANALAGGDKSKLEEIKTLADSLPK